ncbi:SDR family NAD(P)-dependent oxidoreductase [Aquipuribacter nitratireducens]|uniref:SDR family NAD(P)-dependent oxidoreductase n=1 Tax=Aquipuribacter nitratireducens TaxID=650104 RepID=A0ABW0GQW7_9MICO
MTDAALSRPLALVTGASSGIGLEVAKQLAALDLDLVVTAEDAAGLELVAEGISSAGTAVHSVTADLRRPSEVDRLWSEVQRLGRPLGVAVLDAGVGVGGAFVDTDLADEQAVIDLNVSSTVRLAKHVVRDMAGRGTGRVMLLSSVAATVPGPFQAVYNASKAFTHSFGEALQEELADTDVTVTLLVPGPTDTEFFERAGLEGTAVGESDSKDDPEEVARRAVEGLLDGEKVVAGTPKVGLQTFATRFLPEKAKQKAHRRMSEPGSAG